MRLFRIVVVSICILVGTALIAGLLILRSVKRGALPKYNGEITVNGLSEKVTIFRDEKGMPHIYAENEKDLYFATGFVMAQERLWQMDLIRRATTGRLSEIFGRDLVKTDLFLRCLDMSGKSKKMMKAEDPLILSYLNAYADGVNAYIQSAGRKLPPEFRILGYTPDPWKIGDISNIIGYMGWELAQGNLTADIYIHKMINKLGAEKTGQLIPMWNIESTVVYPDFTLNDTMLMQTGDFIACLDKLNDLGIVSFSASNNWAVSGSRSETGKPLLSNDMHLGFGSPGIWMQIHEVIPGRLNVTGVAIPGQPFIVAGHNERIAWGITNLGVDDIDLFAEQVNPDNPVQYYFNGSWRDMIIKEEVIKVKGEDPDTFKMTFTHRGPIISPLRNITDKSLSMHWSGFDPSNEVKAVYLLNSAGNWNEFRHALSFFRSISQNFAYADIDGNIGLQTAGGIPLRKGRGTLIRNGSTSEYDWKGYVPFEQLPFTFNPSSGEVSSANNKTVNDRYPYYIGAAFSLPFRINRIRQMLGEKQVLGTDDFRMMLLDQHSGYAALLVPFILKLQARKNELNQAENQALDILATWDYDMNAELSAPTIFEFFRKAFIRNLLGDEIGDIVDQLPNNPKDYYLYRILREGPDSWVDNITTPVTETLDDILLKSFSDCISALTVRFGEDQSEWLWGNIHKISFDHPLGSEKMLNRLFRFNSETFPVGGSDHTVNPFAFNSAFRSVHGASQRHIFNTADWDKSLTVIPTGESGIPASEFYLSQTKDFLNGRFYTDAFTEKAVRMAAKYRLVLKPS